jgi:hypothetical protein
MEAIAAEALTSMERAEEAAAARPQQTTIPMTCPFCEEDVQFPAEVNGKREPCPNCKRILQVPRLEDDQQKDWRANRRVGPTGAMVNQQEQLEGAWGSTTDRSFVSGEALEEADALPVIEEEPIGVGGWIRRGFIAAVVLGVVVGLYFWISSWIVNTRNQGALADALNAFQKAEEAEKKEIEDEKGKPVKARKEEKKMPPGWKAAFYLHVGEVHARKETPEPVEALDYFRKARFQFPPPSSKKVPPAYDEELLLAEVALAKVQLGGSEDQAIAKTHLGWSDVQKELERAISGISSPEGQLFALRQVSFALLTQDQGGIAIGLTNQLASSGRATGPGFQAQKIVLFVALKQDKQAKDIAAPPPEKGKINYLERLGYAQGNALLGQFEEATRIVQQPGPSNEERDNQMDQLKASLAVAEIAHWKKADDHAKTQVEFCHSLVKNGLGKLINQDVVLPLLVCRLGRLSARLEMGETTQEMQTLLATYHGGKPHSNLAGVVQLEVLRQQAAKSSTPIDAETVKDRKSLAYVQALILQARQKARLGQAPTVSEVEILEEKYRPFPLIGAALGK